MTGTTGEQLLDIFRATIPPLDGQSYKGQHGKVGVVGGSAEYTGAPYFAAISAQKAGADLLYVICTPEACLPLKTTSPDLIVLPCLPSAEDSVHEDGALPAAALERLTKAADTWLPRMSVLVVGPGLGEAPGPQAAAAFLIRRAREAGLPLVIDGSGVSTIARAPTLVQGYKRCVITPNIAELGRLGSALGVSMGGRMGAAWQEHVPQVAEALQGPALVSKGPTDAISDGSGTTAVCAVPGSNKRPGGIGDVLAGTMGCFLGWQYARKAGEQAQGEPSALQVLAASYAACTVVRAASHAGFVEHRRAMSAQDVIDHLHTAFVRQLGC